MKKNVLDDYRTLLQRDQTGELQVTVGFLDITPYITVVSERSGEVIRNTRVFTDWHDSTLLNMDDDDLEDISDYFDSFE